MTEPLRSREQILGAVREALDEYHRETGQLADDLSLALSLAELSGDRAEGQA